MVNKAVVFLPSARMRSEGYGSVYDYSRTTGYEAAYERYQQRWRYIEK